MRDMNPLGSTKLYGTVVGDGRAGDTSHDVARLEDALYRSAGFCDEDALRAAQPERAPQCFILRRLP